MRRFDRPLTKLDYVVGLVALVALLAACLMGCGSTIPVVKRTDQRFLQLLERSPVPGVEHRRGCSCCR